MLIIGRSQSQKQLGRPAASDRISRGHADSGHSSALDRDELLSCEQAAHSAIPSLQHSGKGKTPGTGKGVEVARGLEEGGIQRRSTEISGDETLCNTTAAENGSMFVKSHRICTATSDH